MVAKGPFARGIGRADVTVIGLFSTILAKAAFAASVAEMALTVRPVRLSVRVVFDPVRFVGMPTATPCSADVFQDKVSGAALAAPEKPAIAARPATAIRNFFIRLSNSIGPC